MTIVEALKNLYVAMGGEAESVENFSLNSKMLNAIAELVSSGATRELPAGGAKDQVLSLDDKNKPVWRDIAGLPDYGSETAKKYLYCDWNGALVWKADVFEVLFYSNGNASKSADDIVAALETGGYRTALATKTLTSTNYYHCEYSGLVFAGRETPSDPENIARFARIAFDGTDITLVITELKGASKTLNVTTKTITTT